MSTPANPNNKPTISFAAIDPNLTQPVIVTSHSSGHNTPPSQAPDDPEVTQPIHLPDSGSSVYNDPPTVGFSSAEVLGLLNTERTRRTKTSELGNRFHLTYTHFMKSLNETCKDKEYYHIWDLYQWQQQQQPNNIITVFEALNDADRPTIERAPAGTTVLRHCMYVAQHFMGAAPYYNAVWDFIPPAIRDGAFATNSNNYGGDGPQRAAFEAEGIRRLWRLLDQFDDEKINSETYLKSYFTYLGGFRPFNERIERQKYADLVNHCSTLRTILRANVPAKAHTREQIQAAMDDHLQRIVYGKGTVDKTQSGIVPITADQKWAVQYINGIFTFFEKNEAAQKRHKYEDDADILALFLLPHSEAQKARGDIIDPAHGQYSVYNDVTNRNLAEIYTTKVSPLITALGLDPGMASYLITYRDSRREDNKKENGQKSKVEGDVIMGNLFATLLKGVHTAIQAGITRVP